MSKKHHKQQEKVTPKPKESKKEVEEKPEKPFDFGGFPDRDLKKNLGCG